VKAEHSTPCARRSIKEDQVLVGMPGLRELEKNKERKERTESKVGKQG
jgi:hypothetical protein